MPSMPSLLQGLAAHSRSPDLEHAAAPRTPQPSPPPLTSRPPAAVPQNTTPTFLQVKYSQLIHGLKTENIEVNRKMLSELAMNEPYSFKALVDQVRYMHGGSGGGGGGSSQAAAAARAGQ